MKGKVIYFFKDGIGQIKGEDGKTYFVHWSNIGLHTGDDGDWAYGDMLNKRPMLTEGDEVKFRPIDDDPSRTPRAIDVEINKE